MAFSLDTTTPSTLKAEAKALRAERAADGQTITHSAALEAVAHQHGFRDWNTAVAALPERFAVPAQVGQRVRGTYLKQPFTGTVIAVEAMTDFAHFRVTVRFDTPVDVVTSELFSAFRQRVTATLDARGVSPARTSDGEPHMRLSRA